MRINLQGAGVSQPSGSRYAEDASHEVHGPQISNAPVDDVSEGGLM